MFSGSGSSAGNSGQRQGLLQLLGGRVIEQPLAYGGGEGANVGGGGEQHSLLIVGLGQQAQRGGLAAGTDDSYHASTSEGNEHGYIPHFHSDMVATIKPYSRQDCKCKEGVVG